MTADNKGTFVVHDRRMFTPDGEERGGGAAGPGQEDELATAREESDREAETTPAAGPPPEVAAEVERLRQAFADLEATKARVTRDAERQIELLRADTLEALFPVLDNLERSIAAAERSHGTVGLLEGVKLVHGQFLQALERFGLERVSAVGQRFDPRLHDALAVVPVADPALDGVCVEEIEPAYRMGDRVVRPAKVQVGRAADRPSA